MSSLTVLKQQTVFLCLATLALFGCGSTGGDERPAADTDPLTPSAFYSPPLEYRPWVRWWWPGGDVDNAELAREVRLLADHGFGGAEIQPFDAALDPDVSAEDLARRRSFDTQAFYRHLAAALEAASACGLTVDVNLGSGWPSGGTHVAPGQSLKTLLYSERTLQGPVRTTLTFREPDVPLFYAVAWVAERLLGEKMARFEGHRAELLQVVAARVRGGARSRTPLDLNDHLDLDPDSVQVLTGLVDSHGRLTWDVPEGNWVILGFYEAPVGEYPLLNAQPEPGYVVDHLDSNDMRQHLDHLYRPATGLTPYLGDPLRALFNDSLEFKAERLFASDFLTVFKERRGYDLTPWLPAIPVPGADNSVFDTAAIRRGPAFTLTDGDDRVRYDYRLTVSDLYVDRFVEPRPTGHARKACCCAPSLTAWTWT